MKLVMAAAAAVLISAGAFAQTGHYQEIVDVCAGSGDPTATPDYCACSAGKLAVLPDMDQIILVEVTKWSLANPNPTEDQKKTFVADMRARTGLATDEELSARVNAVGDAAAAADAACMAQSPAPAAQ